MSMVKDKDVNVIVVGDDQATGCGVDITIAGHSFTTTGSAKRHPRDDHDPVTAELLAAGRAFRKLGDELMLKAESRIQPVSIHEMLDRLQELGQEVAEVHQRETDHRDREVA